MDFSNMKFVLVLTTLYVATTVAMECKSKELCNSTAVGDTRFWYNAFVKHNDTAYTTGMTVDITVTGTQEEKEQSCVVECSKRGLDETSGCRRVHLSPDGTCSLSAVDVYNSTAVITEVKAGWTTFHLKNDYCERAMTGKLCLQDTPCRADFVNGVGKCDCKITFEGEFCERYNALMELDGYWNFDSGSLVNDGLKQDLSQTMWNGKIINVPGRRKKVLYCNGAGVCLEAPSVSTCFKPSTSTYSTACSKGMFYAFWFRGTEDGATYSNGELLDNNVNGLRLNLQGNDIAFTFTEYQYQHKATINIGTHNWFRRWNFLAMVYVPGSNAFSLYTNGDDGQLTSPVQSSPTYRSPSNSITGTKFGNSLKFLIDDVAYIERNILTEVPEFVEHYYNITKHN